jgi:hypothetical protein
MIPHKQKNVHRTILESFFNKQFFKGRNVVKNSQKIFLKHFI